MSLLLLRYGSIIAEFCPGAHGTHFKADGIGSAASKAGQALLNSEALRAGSGKAVKGAAEALTGSENIWKKPIEAVRAAGNEVLTNRDLREKPVEALERGAQEVLTNEKMHRGVMAGGEMVGRVSVDAAEQLAQQVLFASGLGIGDKVAEKYPRWGEFIKSATQSGADISTLRDLLVTTGTRPEDMKKLADDLKRISQKYGL